MMRFSSTPQVRVRIWQRDGLYRWQNADALGPHDGDAGIRKDAAMVADMREKCGEDFWLMLDCWMSQDVNYATKLAHACAPYNLKWIEECPPPQQYEGYRELKHNAPAGMMVTSGEHHGTLQSFRTLSKPVSTLCSRMLAGAVA